MNLFSENVCIVTENVLNFSAVKKNDEKLSFTLFVFKLSSGDRKLYPIDDYFIGNRGTFSPLLKLVPPFLNSDQLMLVVIVLVEKVIYC